jgi:cell wall-associated NlpC family hydrolase
MELVYKPGHIYHLTDEDVVDAEIKFSRPENGLGFQLEELNMAYELQGLGIERELMQAAMSYLKSRIWEKADLLKGQELATLGSQFNVVGLLQDFYSDVFGVELPGDLAGQMKHMFPIDLDAAIPGDALFWGDNDNLTTAGIYLGGGQMLTVSIQNGVVTQEAVGRFDLPNFVRTLR